MGEDAISAESTQKQLIVHKYGRKKDKAAELCERTLLPAPAVPGMRMLRGLSGSFMLFRCRLTGLLT